MSKERDEVSGASWFAYAPMKGRDSQTPEDRIRSEELARKRLEALRRRHPDGSPQRLRLMSDYSAVPLWSEDGMIEPADLGLSSGLTSAILAWDELFQRDFHGDEGWLDEGSRDEYARLAPLLRDRLAVEVAAFGEVELRLWPLESPQPISPELEELLSSFEPSDDGGSVPARAGETIWIAADFGIDWPLWREEDDGSRMPMASDELRLSSDLSDQLAAWLRSWQGNFDPETGWVSPFAHRASREYQRALRTRLQIELGTDADVRCG